MKVFNQYLRGRKVLDLYYVFRFRDFVADFETLLRLLLAAVWLVLWAESDVCSILSDYFTLIFLY